MSEERTKEALAKVHALLIEYDLWGCLTVCDTERTHWIYHFDTSWSCMHFSTDTGEIRVRAKVADFTTPEGQHYVVQNTVGAVFSTRDYAAMLFSHMDKLAKLLDKQGLGIEHKMFQDLKYEKPK